MTLSPNRAVHEDEMICLKNVMLGFQSPHFEELIIKPFSLW